MKSRNRKRKGNSEFLGIKRRLRTEMTKAERLLWHHLRGRQLHGVKFRRQHGVGPYILDFYCADKNLVIEVDGDVHAGPEQINKDNNRQDYLHSLDFRIVRYTNDDIFRNVAGVLEDLSQRLFGVSTSPSPSLQRRGKTRNNFRC